MPQGLASIGLSVVVNAAELNYVTEIGDIGGNASQVDATCFQDTVRKSAVGVQDDDTFEVSYLFDNSDTDSDFRRLKTLQDEKRLVPIAVILPDCGEDDGLAFLCSGYINTYVTGAKTDELFNAQLIITKQGDWEPVPTPYEITEALQDSNGNYLLDSSGNQLLGTVVLQGGIT